MSAPGQKGIHNSAMQISISLPHLVQRARRPPMVVDLFYSTSVLEDETLGSMMQAMDVLAHHIRPEL